ncbi:MAG: adenylate/guanylate cyclase domain-containing protein [Gammaproteobacteria bacterium]|nr:MAG: adenylate/guanylate cyclase domain-containing protein [Gammaproteobacteria bacterium]
MTVSATSLPRTVLRHGLRYLLGILLITLFLLHVRGDFRLPLLDQLDNMIYDLQLGLTAPRSVDRRIVIADIDEYSLSKLGHWPWRRDVLARIINRLFDDYGVRVVGFDIAFPEPFDPSARRLLGELAETRLRDDPQFQAVWQKLAPGLDTDQALARALQGRPVVLGHIFRQRVRANEPREIGALPPPLRTLDETTRKRLGVPRPQGYTGNLPRLVNATGRGGFFDNPLVDPDGIFRRVPLLQVYQGKLYESLTIAMLRAAHDIPAEQVRLEIVPYNERRDRGVYALEQVIVGKFRIPVDNRGAVLVPYRGPEHSFPYVSMADIHDGSAPRDVLKDAFVLIGTSAPGLKDLRFVPLQKRGYPGVEVHANLLSGMLDGRIKAHPQYLIAYEFLLLIVLGLTLLLALPRLTPLGSTLLTLGLLAGVLGISHLAWTAYDMVLPLASPLALILLMLILHVTIGFFVETRGKRQLAHLFGQYVPPELVDEMSEDPEDYSVEPESRELTVLFSDIRDFTRMSEGMSPPELAELINDFLTPMTGIIHRHRGTIDKYMGDAIMAFWGAPLADPEHARHALEAAWAMIRELDRLNAQFAERGWPRIAIGIGLNTGEMNVGNMGSAFRMAYTVMGDEVNLGSRLEGLTKVYGVNIIVSEATRRAVDDWLYRELDQVRVKGKERPVRIFEPLGPADEVPGAVKSEVRQFRQALEAYRQQDWDGAEVALFNLSQAHPESVLYRLYLDRIAWFRSHPPPEDWDGIFSHSTK